jgi:hypothetical protein
MNIVAQTILEQLGSHRFIAMTGAKDFVGGYNCLHFKLPSNFAKHKITVVKITLTDADLYDVEFGKIRRGCYQPVESHEGLFFDQLQEVFTSVTGLDTHL